MIHFCIVEAETKLYIMLNDDNTIVGYENETAGVRSWEDAYNRSHRRGYEASMSACINAISFRPSIVSAADIDEIESLLAPDRSVVAVRNVAGGIRGACTNVKAKEYWDRGVKPRLISI